jgi:hypothetical protein
LKTFKGKVFKAFFLGMEGRSARPGARRERPGGGKNGKAQHEDTFSHTPIVLSLRF